MVEHVNNGSYTAINWNDIEDALDKATWEKLTQQFWLDTRIPISNDLRNWRGDLNDTERRVYNLVFGGLTTLDTLQSQDGMASLRRDAVNQKEEAVLNNIQFMESVHAKSYSSIFETLNESQKSMPHLSGPTMTNSCNTRLTRLMMSTKTEHLCKRRLLRSSWKLSCSTLVSTRLCTTWATTGC